MRMPGPRPRDCALNRNFAWEELKKLPGIELQLEGIEVLTVELYWKNVVVIFFSLLGALLWTL